MIDVSIITTCKGRLSFLKQTLPMMLDQITSFTYEVVVVDYGCPQNTFEWCKTLEVPNLRVIKVLDNSEIFNLSRARNCGATVCISRVLLFMDADIKLQSQWLQLSALPILSGEVSITIPWLGKGEITNTPWAGGEKQLGLGLISTYRTFYLYIRGFDEDMKGWGFEDDCFFFRVKELGKVGRSPGPPLLEIIEHSDDIRFEHYETNNRAISHNANQLHARTRKIVNPNGFGKAKLEVWP